MNKKAMELSINFIVILILSITILGFGITFAYKLMDTAQDYNVQVSERIQSELQRSLSSGERVQLIKDSTTNPDKYKKYALGIINVQNSGPHFYFSIYPLGAFDKQNNEIDNVLIDENNLVYIKGYKEIQNNEKAFLGIIVKINNTIPKGQYGMSVWVCATNDPIENPLPCNKDSDDLYWDAGLYQSISVN